MTYRLRFLSACIDQEIATFVAFRSVYCNWIYLYAN